MRDGVSYQNNLGQIAVCWSSGLRDADSGLAQLEWRLWKELNGTWVYVQQGHLVVGDPRLTTALSSRNLTLYSAEPPVKDGSSVVAQRTSPATVDTWGLVCCICATKVATLAPEPVWPMHEHHISPSPPLRRYNSHDKPF